jgi:hypothetical protein
MQFTAAGQHGLTAHAHVGDIAWSARDGDVNLAGTLHPHALVADHLLRYVAHHDAVMY